MKRNILSLLLMSSVVLTGCDDFLNRPAEDVYTSDNYYQTDEQCIAGINYLYSSPWFDFAERGYYKIGEIFAGNLYMGNSPYLTFTLNGTDEDLIKTSKALYGVIAHCNTQYDAISKAGCSEKVRRQCMGECLAWKAMAYFYLVRMFGDVPIIHNTDKELASGEYNSQRRVRRQDVYEYIVMTLEKAIELLPDHGDPGRIDGYCAKGLMAKVYLTRSGLGMSGSRNQEYLDKAAELSLDVIENSGRQLMPVYSDIFRLKNNRCEEGLFTWHWTTINNAYTCASRLQSELAIGGFTEFGDTWGGWTAPTADLIEAFGTSPLENPDNRADIDTRRKATLMMAGDKYEYFWQDKGGFDYLRFIYDAEYGKGGPGGELQSGTGTNCVKHLYGNSYDHKEGCGVDAVSGGSGLATHILRLADVYLIHAEAVIGNNASTSVASAVDAFNAVRGRAIPGVTPRTSISFDDVWKERRLELAHEGDRWFDYVRLSYYNVGRAISEIKAQHRDQYYGLNDLYKNYYESGSWNYNPSKHYYNASAAVPALTAESFTMPLPTEDVVFNPHLLEPAISLDVRNVFSY